MGWYSNIFKTDKMRTGGLWLFFGQIFTTLISLGLTYILANLLLPEDFGTYKFVLSVSSVLAIFSLTGINTAVTRSIALNYDGVLKKSVVVQLRWGMLTFFGSLILAAVLYFSNNIILALSFVMIGIFTPLANSANTYKCYFLGKENFKWSAIFSLSHSILAALITVIAVLISKNLIVLIIVYFFTSAVINFFLYLITLNFFKLNNKIDSSFLNFGKHLSLITGINTLTQYLDSFIVFCLLGPSQLGNYVLVLAGPETIRGLLRIIPTMYFPKFTKLTGNEIRSKFFIKLIPISLLVITLILIYSIISPIVFKTFFVKYTDANLLIPLSAWLMIGAINAVLESCLAAQKAVKEIYVSGTALPIFQIVSMLSLGLLMGISGLIVSKILTYTISIILNYKLLTTKQSR